MQNGELPKLKISFTFTSHFSGHMKSPDFTPPNLPPRLQPRSSDVHRSQDPGSPSPVSAHAPTSPVSPGFGSTTPASPGFGSTDAWSSGAMGCCDRGEVTRCNEQPDVCGGGPGMMLVNDLNHMFDGYITDCYRMMLISHCLTSIKPAN